ncbi:aldo/keto reductase [Modestobacter muralis]|uniref:Aldo/keto reductase n=1 Tax=Modestobacter muralis TaxID=1608614 RepID=A0A6P0HFW6_9ACTN|nr:aldo/keto reductase [Modestobacter muralis]NEK96544.1 aldo/keto reductase [Modestobacter muralis]NEN53444.1 aldo/keto reductase [Modestobacter muralis]
MLQRPLGSSSLTVSALGFGAGHIDVGDMTEREARVLLDGVLELGVTFIDTARGYGASEERLGRWMSPHREAVVLSTKVGYDVPGQEDWTAGAVREGVERALRVLQTDRIDVMFLHSCPVEVLQTGEVVEALLACRSAGKVLAAGYSGENVALSWAGESGLFDVLQTSVNIADQHSRRAVLPFARQRGIGVVAKRPLANAAWRYRERPIGVYGETYWQRLRHMNVQPQADDWVGTAIRFSAFTPGVSTAIVGTSSLSHLAHAAMAVDRGPLPLEEAHQWEDAFRPHEAEWSGEV